MHTAPMATAVWVNGKITDRDSAVISVFDRGFLYGDSVYEVMGTAGGRPVDVERHLDRLARSAESLMLTMPTRLAITSAIDETLARAQNDDSYVRIVVTRGGGAITLDIAAAKTPSLIIIAEPLVMPDDRLYTDGAHLAIVGVERTSVRAVDPAVKSGNYLNNIMALAEARQRGAYEAVMCGPDGRVAEGSTSNLFVVKDGGLITPTLATGILPGITRQRVLEIAAEQSVSAREGDLWPEDVRTADEVFITSSIRGVMPVTRVDDQVIGAGVPGQVTQAILSAYRAFLAEVAAGAR